MNPGLSSSGPCTPWFAPLCRQVSQYPCVDTWTNSSFGTNEKCQTSSSHVHPPSVHRSGSTQSKVTMISFGGTITLQHASSNKKLEPIDLPHQLTNTNASWRMVLFLVRLESTRIGSEYETENYHGEPHRARKSVFKHGRRPDDDCIYHFLGDRASSEADVFFPEKQRRHHLLKYACALTGESGCFLKARLLLLESRRHFLSIRLLSQFENNKSNHKMMNLNGIII